MTAKKGHNKNWDLPEHQPPTGAWDNISGKLDGLSSIGGYGKAMNSMPEHVPPPVVWDKIAADLQPVFFPPAILYRVLLPLLIIVGGLIGGYYILDDAGENPVVTVKSHSEDSRLSVQAQQPPSDQTQQQNTDQSIQNSAEQSPQQSLETTTNQSAGSENQNSYRNDEKELIVAASPENIPPTAGRTDAEVVKEDPLNASDQKLLAAYLDNNIRKTDNEYFPEISGLSPIYVSHIYMPNSISSYRLPLKARNSNFDDIIPFDKKPSNKNKAIDRLAWSLMAGVESINIPEADKNAFAWHIDLGVAWKFKKLFIESGLGYAQVSCDESYEVDYLRNEVILKYERVDSVVYSLDTVNLQIERDYVTSEHEVYDSVDYQQNMQQQRRSSYIQIPLLLGYRHSFKKSGIYVKTGAVLSIITNTHTTGIELDDPEARITAMTPKLVCPAETNWQYVLSAGYTLGLGRKFSMAIEPQFRYYMGSYVFSTGGKSKNPYSFGVRAGIYYNF